MWSRLHHGLVTKLLFPCPPSSYRKDSFPDQLVWVPNLPFPGRTSGTGERGAGGKSVPCLLLKHEKPTVLAIFFHGNGEDLGRVHNFSTFFRTCFNSTVLAVEYPGYGVHEASNVSREGIIENAHAVLRYATHELDFPLERIVIVGRSIGSGPCLMLASSFKVGCCILVAPFRSVKRCFGDALGERAAEYVDEWFDNEEAIRKLSTPVLFVHGQQDHIVSWRHSLYLYEQCVARKVLIAPEKMMHNSCLAENLSWFVHPVRKLFNDLFAAPADKACEEPCDPFLAPTSWVPQMHDFQEPLPEPECTSEMDVTEDITEEETGAGALLEGAKLLREGLFEELLQDDLVSVSEESGVTLYLGAPGALLSPVLLRAFSLGESFVVDGADSIGTPRADSEVCSFYAPSVAEPDRLVPADGDCEIYVAQSDPAAREETDVDEDSDVSSFYAPPRPASSKERRGPDGDSEVSSFYVGRQLSLGEEGEEDLFFDSDCDSTTEADTRLAQGDEQRQRLETDESDDQEFLLGTVVPMTLGMTDGSPITELYKFDLGEGTDSLCEESTDSPDADAVPPPSTELLILGVDTVDDLAAVVLDAQARPRLRAGARLELEGGVRSSIGDVAKHIQTSTKRNDVVSQNLECTGALLRSAVPEIVFPPPT